MSFPSPNANHLCCHLGEYVTPPPLSFSKKPLFCGNAPNEREEAATLSVEGEYMMDQPQPEQEGLVGLAAAAG